MNPQLPSEVRKALTDRVTGTTVSAVYRQTADDAWSESYDPLIPEWQPSSLTHLSFFVDDRELEETERTRSRVDEAPLVSAPIVVRFLYALRPRQRTEDWDAAATAGAHLLRRLLGHSWSEDLVVQTDRRPITRIPTSFVDAPGAWVNVEVRVRVLYMLNLIVPDFDS